jgi:hypothetical protein
MNPRPTFPLLGMKQNSGCKNKAARFNGYLAAPSAGFRQRSMILPPEARITL